MHDNYKKKCCVGLDAPTFIDILDEWTSNIGEMLYVICSYEYFDDEVCDFVYSSEYYVKPLRISGVICKSVFNAKLPFDKGTLRWYYTFETDDEIVVPCNNDLIQDTTLKLFYHTFELAKEALNEYLKTLPNENNDK